MHVKMRFSNMNSKIIQDQITYQKIVINENLRYFKPSSVKKQKTFLNEITLSLNRTPKSINPKFFYDNTGSKLFDMICSLPEYYLYNSEIEILRNIKKEIKSYIDSEIRLVELGSGSSIKTRILLDTLYDLQTDVEYFPIDISDILSFSTQELCNIYKDLKITGIIDTYENGLNFIEGYDNKPNLISFLGSSFGNFNHLEGIQFLKTISTMMKDSDLFLIGFDLKKNESILQIFAPSSEIDAYIPNPITSCPDAGCLKFQKPFFTSSSLKPLVQEFVLPISGSIKGHLSSVVALIV